MIFNEPARGKVIRTLAIYGLLFLVGTAGFLMGIVSSAIVLLVLATIFALGSGYMSLQAIRDLGSSPVTTSGAINGKFARNDFILFGRRYYIRLGRRPFIVDRAAFQAIERGDVVSIVHYPYTGMVERIELAPPSPEEGGEDAPDWRWPDQPRERQQ